MYGCIRDWPAFYHEAYASLEPGGWFEQSEISVAPVSDDGTVPQGHIFQRWGEISLEAGEKFGKTLRIHGQARGLLESAEDKWENVREHVFKLPIGTWPRDKKLKKIGAVNRIYWEEGIEGWCLALLTRVMGVGQHAQVLIYKTLMYAVVLCRSPVVLDRNAGGFERSVDTCISPIVSMAVIQRLGLTR